MGRTGFSTRPGFTVLTDCTAMRLTIPHYFDFGSEQLRTGHELLGPDAWDAVRETEGPFGLPRTRAEWEARAADPAAAARAHDIVRIARDLHVRRLCSYGVGTGVVELHLARAAPDVELVCTDFAPRSVARLEALFSEATVVQHDLLHDAPLAADLHVLHRVDTEFSTVELARILARFEKPVLFVPAQLLTARQAARELLLRVRHPRAVKAGWLRSEDAFRALWPNRGACDVQIGELPGFLLN